MPMFIHTHELDITFSETEIIWLVQSGSDAIY